MRIPKNIPPINPCVNIKKTPIKLGVFISSAHHLMRGLLKKGLLKYKLFGFGCGHDP